MDQSLKRRPSTEAATSTESKKSKIDVSPLTLIDLNEDCLIEIFNYISMDELVSMADFDDSLGNAARQVFSRKFGDDCIVISNRFDRANEDLPWSVKLLKHFGAVITKLHIIYEERFRRIDAILDNAIIAHCRKSLVEIKFENADSFTMHDINKPFEKVCQVTFVRSEVCDLIPNFSKWFPVADKLHLEYQKRQEHSARRMLETHYPRLLFSKIWNTTDERSTIRMADAKINNYNLTSFLKLNPQLKSLSIICDEYNIDSARDRDNLHERVPIHVMNPYGTNRESRNIPFQRLLYDFDGIRMDRELLTIINAELKDLEELTVIHKSEIPGPTFENIFFKKLKKLSVSFRGSDVLNSFPIATTGLEQLRLAGIELKQSAIDFLRRHRDVKILKFDGRWQSTQCATDMMELLATLPALEEIRFPLQYRVVTTVQIAILLTTCRMLKKLIISAENLTSEIHRHIHQDLRNIIGSVGSGWRATMQNGWNEHRRYRLVLEKTV